MKELRIVILDFANGPRVDVFDTFTSERAAIAEFAGRCLAAADPVQLPLIAARSCIIPADRLTELLDAEMPATAAVAAYSPLPVTGIAHAMRRYWSIANLPDADRGHALELAKENLIEFYRRYGVEIIFDDGIEELKKAWING